MKAISDINGFDIKVHGNDTEKIIECLYKWLSETLNVHKQDPPLKIFYDYTDFNAELFEKKMREFSSEKLAKNYIDNLSIPEFIKELKESFQRNLI